MSPLVNTIRKTALASPDTAVGELDRLLDTLHRLADPPQRADLLALRAEAMLRAGHIHAAARASAVAAGAAAGLQPHDPPRLITALLIDADVMFFTGNPHETITACNRARDISARFKTHDLPRHQLALALHMAAVYQHVGCHLAQRGLTELYNQIDPDSPLTVIVDAGLAAMRDGCRPGPHHPPPVPVPPLPNCLLHPGLDTGAESYLAYRILSAPAFYHDHSAPPDSSRHQPPSAVRRAVPPT
jgi:hypothetical protein